MKNKRKQIMAYIIMPLSFLIIGYLLIFIAFKPIIDMSMAVIGMFITNEAPGFDKDLATIYQENNNTEDTRKTIPLSSVQIPNYGTLYAKLTCERIGINAPVYFGDTDKILNRGLGHYTGSFLPGFGKTILISGHNNTFFAPLEHVKIGDLFTYQTNYGTYIYRVRETKILHNTDPTAFDLKKEQEELILYTCYDFTRLSGRKQERKFIYLDRILGPDIIEETQQ